MINVIDEKMTSSGNWAGTCTECKEIVTGMDDFDEDRGWMFIGWFHEGQRSTSKWDPCPRKGA